MSRKCWSPPSGQRRSGDHGQSRQPLKAKPSVGRSAQQGQSCSSSPKYSPDLNPIEQVFAKLKHLLRNAAARTIETVLAAIGELLDTFTPQECANYLANAGYRQNLKTSRSRIAACLGVRCHST